MDVWSADRGDQPEVDLDEDKGTLAHTVTQDETALPALLLLSGQKFMQAEETEERHEKYQNISEAATAVTNGLKDRDVFTKGQQLFDTLPYTDTLIHTGSPRIAHSTCGRGNCIGYIGMAKLTAPSLSFSHLEQMV